MEGVQDDLARYFEWKTVIEDEVPVDKKKKTE